MGYIIVFGNTFYIEKFNNNQTIKYEDNNDNIQFDDKNGFYNLIYIYNFLYNILNLYI